MFYSDGWADRKDVVHNLEEQAWGGISMRIHSQHNDDFDKYYLNLKPKTNKRNPWFLDFWETHFKCKFNLTDDEGTAIELKSSKYNRICTGEHEVS